MCLACAPPRQVVYILDQVRALEAEMRRRLQEAGRDPCDVRVVVLTRLIPDASPLGVYVVLSICGPLVVGVCAESRRDRGA